MAAASPRCSEAGHVRIVEQHCPGGAACPSGNERCHKAFYCDGCQAQWATLSCDEHQEAA